MCLVGEQGSVLQVMLQPWSGCNELVASFVNRSNLLKSWEKTETCAVSAEGVYGPNNAMITRIPALDAATESHHFSDRTALV